MTNKQTNNKRKLPKGIYRNRDGYRVKVPKYNLDKCFSIKEYGTDALALESAKIFIKKNSAQEQLNELKSIYDKRKYTVEFAFKRFLEIKNPTISTKNKHIKIFDKYFKNFKSRAITSILPSEIIAMLNSLTDTCTQYTLSAVKTRWVQIYNAAILDGVITTNIASIIDLPRSMVPTRSRPVLTDDETLNKIIDYLKLTKKRNENTIFTNKLIIYALLIMNETGMRPSEVFALNRDSFSFDKHIININARVGSNSTTKYIIVSPKTTNAYRVVPMTEYLEHLIRGLLEYTDEYYLFTDMNGKLLNSDVVSTKIRLINKKLNTDFRMYQLRHTFIKDLIDEGSINQRTIMDLMGHATFGQSLDYSRSTDRELKDAIRKVKE